MESLVLYKIFAILAGSILSFQASSSQGQLYLLVVSISTLLNAQNQQHCSTKGLLFQ